MGRSICHRKTTLKGKVLFRASAFNACLVVCVFLVPSLAHGNDWFTFGDEWTANFSSLASISYSDNPSLVTENAKGRTDITLNRAVDAQYAKDEYRIGVVGRANFVASKDEIAEKAFAADQVRYILDVNGEYDLEAAVVGAAFGINFDTVQNTEFEDAGILTEDVTRTQASFNFNYNRQLSDLWNLSFTDDYTFSTYSGGNFNEFANNTALIGFGYAYNDRLTLAPQFSYSRYEPDSDAIKASNTFRLQGRGDYQLSEDDSLGVTMGAVQTDGNVGWLAIVDYRQEVLDGLVTSASVNRDNIPSSNGNVRETAGLKGGITYQVLEDTRVGFSASWRTSSQVGVTASADTTQLSLSPTVDWVLNEEWRANFNLNHRRQKRPDQGTASSSSAIFALHYNLPLE